MTAEIAILNRSGLAIAADSAITIGNERVWQSSNKLFSLGPRHDLAIMIYGSGDFGGYSWEVVIKEFRLHCAKVELSMLSECVTMFETFISQPRWRDPSAEALSNAHWVVTQLEFLLEGLEFEGNIDFRQKVMAEAQRLTAELVNQKIVMPALPLTEYSAHFMPMVIRFLKELTGRIVTKALGKSVTRYLFECYRRDSNSSGYETGIVFLGYGEDQLFPCFEEWIYDGRLDNYLRFWSGRTMNLNEIGSPAGVIIAFAQQDMVHLFMEGISNNYLTFFGDTIRGVIEDKSKEIVALHSEGERLVEAEIQRRENEFIMSQLSSAFGQMKQMEVINPLMAAVRALPREEMMAMAEAFVELTSMRRKVDSNLQTVGGPVDVAFISKGDGFIWKRRKLYFDPDLNGDYFERRARRLS